MGTAEEIRKIEEHGILSAGWPEQRNYEHFSLRGYGIVIHFDEGQVGRGQKVSMKCLYLHINFKV